MSATTRFTFATAFCCADAFSACCHEGSPTLSVALQLQYIILVLEPVTFKHSQPATHHMTPESHLSVLPGTLKGS